jgi:hypothetical protein
MSFYYHKDAKVAWRPETAFRDADGDSALDEVNAAAATFYPIPVFDKPFLGEHTIRFPQWGRTGTSPDPAYMWTEAAKPVDLVVGGKLWNFAWLRQLTKKCTTSLVSGAYNHVYATSTARPSTPAPSMELLHVIPHATAPRYWLFNGVICKGLQIAATRSAVMATWAMQAARKITGAALDAYPADSGVSPYSGAASNSVSITRGGTAVSGMVHQCNIRYWDGTSVVDDCLSSTYPPYSLHGDRDIAVDLVMTPDDLDLEAWMAEQDPATADAQDIVVTFTRSADDYLSFNFEHVACASASYLDDGGILRIAASFRLKPDTCEPGAKLTITERNAWANTRYGE